MDEGNGIVKVVASMVIPANLLSDGEWTPNLLKD
jgi:hypothetical protein